MTGHARVKQENGCQAVFPCFHAALFPMRIRMCFGAADVRERICDCGRCVRCAAWKEGCHVQNQKTLCMPADWPLRDFARLRVYELISAAVFFCAGWIQLFSAGIPAASFVDGMGD